MKKTVIALLLSASLLFVVGFTSEQEAEKREAQYDKIEAKDNAQKDFEAEEKYIEILKKLAEERGISCDAVCDSISKD